MKNNFVSKFMDKVKNMDYDFAKNFLKHLIVPAFAVILSVVFIFCFNFNLGIDFNGGTVATVVFEQDLEADGNYGKLKSQIGDILKENKVSVKSYSIDETNYYGNAITVKFNKVSEEKVATIKSDLLAEFYATETDADVLDIVVKVNTFEANVDSGVVLSTLLAILVAALAVAIYIGARFGLCAGFISIMFTLFDCALTLAWTCILRVEIEMGIVGSIAFVALYSMISNLIYLVKMNDNLKKEIYAKTNNNDLANITLKKVMPKELVLASIVLLLILFVGIIPSTLVRGATLPALVGVLVSLYSIIMLTPGLWAMFFIRKTKKVKVKEDNKEEQVVVIEEEMVNEKDIEGPEVIVETEAKED